MGLSLGGFTGSGRLGTMRIGTRYKLIVVAVIWVATLAGAIFLFERSEVDRIAIAAGPRDGEAFALAEAIAAELQASRHGLRVDVLETSGSGENLRLLEIGHASLATTQADQEFVPNARLLAFLYPDSYQLLVRQESGIRSFPGLAGKRVAIPPEGGGQFRSFWFLADHYGLDRDDLRALPMAAEAADFAVQEGSVDAIFRVRAAGNQSIQELIRRHPMELVPITHGAALALAIPALNPGVIPAGSYRGEPAIPAADLETVAVRRLLVASEELEPDLARRVAAVLFEKRSALVAATPLAGYIAEPDAAARISLPLHPGAQRYYDREKPAFWQRHARVVAPSLYVLVLLGSGFLALRARWVSSHKERVDRYNLELLQLCERARSAGAEDLADIKSRLIDILQRVIEDLDSDRVTPEEFSYFSFTWQAVESVVRDRQADGAAHPVGSRDRRGLPTSAGATRAPGW